MLQRVALATTGSLSFTIPYLETRCDLFESKEKTGAMYLRNIEPFGTRSESATGAPHSLGGIARSCCVFVWFG